MVDELHQLEARIVDTERQLVFARQGENSDRIAKLENELNAMMRELEAETGKPYVRQEPLFEDPDWWDLVTGG